MPVHRRGGQRRDGDAARGDGAADSVYPHPGLCAGADAVLHRAADLRRYRV